MRRASEAPERKVSMMDLSAVANMVNLNRGITNQFTSKSLLERKISI
jgi:hypothetical protein